MQFPTRNKPLGASVHLSVHPLRNSRARPTTQVPWPRHLSPFQSLGPSKGVFSTSHLGCTAQGTSPFQSLDPCKGFFLTSHLELRSSRLRKKPAGAFVPLSISVVCSTLSYICIEQYLPPKSPSPGTSLRSVPWPVQGFFLRFSHLAALRSSSLGKTSKCLGASFHSPLALPCSINLSSKV